MAACLSAIGAGSDPAPKLRCPFRRIMEIKPIPSPTERSPPDPAHRSRDASIFSSAPRFCGATARRGHKLADWLRFSGQLTRAQHDARSSRCPNAPIPAGAARTRGSRWHHAAAECQRAERSVAWREVLRQPIAGLLPWQHWKAACRCSPALAWRRRHPPGALSPTACCTANRPMPAAMPASCR